MFAVPQSSCIEWARTERWRSFFASSTEGSWTTQKGDCRGKNEDVFFDERVLCDGGFWSYLRVVFFDFEI